MSAEGDHGQDGRSRPVPVSGSPTLPTSHGLMLSLVTGLQLLAPTPLMAQTEGWLLGPNSRTGKDSTVVPTDCVEGPDGSISCNTKIVNPPGDTPARPYYDPFSN
ncbi:putative conserved secreted protein [Synechococcus sp. WH 8101]|nr:putative conserved secreted protein [Synechococcus sp. WH 8101]